MSTKEQYWKYSLITIIIGLGIILASHTTNARGTRKHKIASAVMTVAAMLRFIFRFSDR